MKRIVIVAGFGCLLSGCAHNWEPGPGVNADSLIPTKARCDYIARHGGGAHGFYASGSPRFVAAATLGNAVGTVVGEAIRTSEDFDDCMQMQGWRIANSAPARPVVRQEIVAQAPLPPFSNPPSQNPAPVADDDRTQLIRDAASHLRACISSVRRDPAYAPISQYLQDEETDDFSVAQLSNARRPSANEAGLVAQYVDKSTTCRARTVAALNDVSPTAATILRKQSEAGRLDTLALVKLQISWGEWATRLFKRKAATMAELEQARI